MSALSDLYFQTLNAYLVKFQTSPPHAFINSKTTTLQQKIDAMRSAITNNQPITVVGA